MRLERARAIVDFVVSEAPGPVSVFVADAHGELVAAATMDGAAPDTRLNAQRKAYTAARSRRPHDARAGGEGPRRPRRAGELRSVLHVLPRRRRGLRRRGADRRSRRQRAAGRGRRSSSRCARSLRVPRASTGVALRRRLVQRLERARLPDRVVAAEQQLGLAADRVAHVLELEPVGVDGLELDPLDARRRGAARSPARCSATDRRGRASPRCRSPRARRGSGIAVPQSNSAITSPGKRSVPPKTQSVPDGPNHASP